MTTKEQQRQALSALDVLEDAARRGDWRFFRRQRKIIRDALTARPRRLSETAQELRLRPYHKGYPCNDGAPSGYDSSAPMVDVVWLKDIIALLDDVAGEMRKAADATVAIEVKNAGMMEKALAEMAPKIETSVKAAVKNATFCRDCGAPLYLDSHHRCPGPRRGQRPQRAEKARSRR